MKVEDMVFIGLAGIAIVFVLWFLFGRSPSLEQVIVALVGVNIGFSFKIHGDLQRHMGEHKGYNNARKN